jgi:hypothetical protein
MANEEPNTRIARRTALHALAATTAALTLPSPLRAQWRWPPAPTAAGVLLTTQLEAVALDTCAGVVAFVVPGDDEYSVAQGVFVNEAGGLAGRGEAFLVYSLNNYLPLPVLASWSVSQLLPELFAIPLPVSPALASQASPEQLAALASYGEAIERSLLARGTIPLAWLMAAILNVLAVRVDPRSVSGPFLTPFARLSWDDKALVWQDFEVLLPELLDPLDRRTILPRFTLFPDLFATLSGLVDFAAAAILELAAFGSYSEYAFLVPGTRVLSERPVGWELTNYQPFGPVEGWDELRGYYQGRTAVGG